jgi:uncharacterized protein (TIGR00255 family)
MTGYGEAERPSAGGLLRVEIKTVNHRFLNTSVRTPPGFDRFEQEISGWLRPYVSRGHAHVVIMMDRSVGEEAGDDLPVLDLERARRYAALLRQLRDEVGLAGEVDVTALLRFDVLRTPEAPAARPEVDPVIVQEVLEEAARQVVAMRELEGRRLQDDLEGRLGRITEELGRVESRAPERLARERDRLREAVRALAGQEDVDEERLAREIAWMAEKWDINEEIVRFRSHVALFRETLAADGAEAVGKRLSFVVQEMHREANTIGAKANDAGIARSSVAMKEEIERLREQVENVE